MHPCPVCQQRLPSALMLDYIVLDGSSHTLDFSMLGVRLSFFIYFVDICGGRDALQGLTDSD